MITSDDRYLEDTFKENKMNDVDRIKYIEQIGITFSDSLKDIPLTLNAVRKSCSIAGGMSDVIQKFDRSIVEINYTIRHFNRYIESLPKYIYGIKLKTDDEILEYTKAAYSCYINRLMMGNITLITDGKTDDMKIGIVTNNPHAEKMDRTKVLELLEVIEDILKVDGGECHLSMINITNDNDEE